MGGNLVYVCPGPEEIGHFAYAQAKLLGVLAARKAKADRLYSSGRCFIAREDGAGTDQRVDPAVGEALRRYRVSTRAGGVLCEVFEANND
ncbi:hypothetical protein AWB70_04106 [Caballeronia cordobensis]|uniref:Uncharacterized protein n=1 Tax=Caballeronia cordobensis TaxID=1353886 RepID=A0A158I345_CABCO|nr:hypothetical protein AWB70_04106 [Caballeronia cordobensis]